jgi:hypothetical protein
MTFCTWLRIEEVLSIVAFKRSSGVPCVGIVGSKEYPRKFCEKSKNFFYLRIWLWFRLVHSKLPVLLDIQHLKWKYIVQFVNIEQNIAKGRKHLFCVKKIIGNVTIFSIQVIVYGYAYIVYENG